MENLISLNTAMKTVDCTLREHLFIEEACWPEKLFPFYSLQIRDCENPYIPVSILMCHCTLIHIIHIEYLIVPLIHPDWFIVS